MNREEIKTYFESLAQDSGLDLTDRIINKFVNLSLELSQEDIDVEEIREEFTTIAPSDSDEWLDFIDEASTYVMEKIMDDYSLEDAEED